MNKHSIIFCFLKESMKNATKTRLSLKNKAFLLQQLYKSYKKSDKCHVGYNNRKNIVFGQGNINATLMIIGEAPGKEEDEQGLPFVGRSGKLLDQILDVAQINKEELYITNVLKCRPEKNRTPTDQEIKICTEQFLMKQIAIIEPKIIVTLGAIATKVMLGTKIKITKIHGQIFIQNNFIIIPIYHPSYILRNRRLINDFESDFKRLKEILKKYS